MAKFIDVAVILALYSLVIRRSRHHCTRTTILMVLWPSSVLLFAADLGGLAFLRRKARKPQQALSRPKNEKTPLGFHPSGLFPLWRR